MPGIHQLRLQLSAPRCRRPPFSHNGGTCHAAQHAYASLTADTHRQTHMPARSRRRRRPRRLPRSPGATGVTTACVNCVDSRRDERVGVCVVDD